jgi:hypothetical protein
MSNQFILIDDKIINLAHVVKVQNYSDGSVKITMSSVSAEGVGSQDWVTTSNWLNFHGDEASALRSYFGKIGTDILGQYHLETHRRKVQQLATYLSIQLVEKHGDQLCYHPGNLVDYIDALVEKGKELKEITVEMVHNAVKA